MQIKIRYLNIDTIMISLFKLDNTKLTDTISIDGLQVEDVNSFTYLCY